MEFEFLLCPRICNMLCFYHIRKFSVFMCLESEKEDSAGTVQSEVVRYQSGENHRQILKAVSPNQQEKEEEALPIELQTYISSNGGHSCDDLISNSST